MHPLRSFADGHLSAPGMAEGRFIFPVKCKTDTGIGRRATNAHYIKDAAGILHKGGIRYGARWVCGTPGSSDVILLPAGHARPLCQICKDRRHPGVYRCFGDGGNLLYVGSTLKRTARLREHEVQASWWPQVTSIRFTEFPGITEARRAEWLAIVTELPAFNRLGVTA
jgi:hypothetical protein